MKTLWVQGNIIYILVGSRCFPEGIYIEARQISRNRRIPKLKYKAIFFDSYTSSNAVGAMKPNPKIYNAALKSLGVSAKESIYVDDYDIEADGARVLGFTAFHIDREGKLKSQWTIKSLREIVDYVNQQG